MPNKQLGGSIPQVVRNPEGLGIKRLYFSQAEHALIKDKTCAPGYGFLRAGTVMSVNSSASPGGNNGKLVPYAPVYTSVTLGGAGSEGIAAAVANGASGHFYVSNADAYKFKIGDEIVYQNTAGDGLVDMGNISAITPGVLYTDIVTEAYIHTNATVVKGAYCYVKTDLATGTPWSTARFILDKDVDTGVGEEAVGALAPVLVSNAILYTASLVNATAAALTALGASNDGPHTILK